MMPRTEPARGKKRACIITGPFTYYNQLPYCVYYIAGFAGVEETFISLTQRYFPSVFLKYE